MCLSHHALKYSAPPTLDDFLKNPHYSALLREWMVQAEPAKASLLEAWYALEDFAAVTTRQTLRARAPVLFRKYFQAGTRTCLDLGETEPSVAEMITAVEAAACTDAPKATAFEPVMPRIHALLKIEFDGGFRVSDQFMLWQEQNTGLPTPRVPETRAAYLEQMGLDVSAAYGVAGTSASAPHAPGAAGVAESKLAEPADLLTALAT